MIYHGDLSTVLPTLGAESIDACVTDPPYDLTANKRGGSGLASINLESPYGRARIGTGNGTGGFMGKKWDGTGVAFRSETWREVARVLKPGAQVCAFGGPRTFHRLTCAIEDAGFEIRDCLSWLYGQGFPKSLNVGNGQGTALKPAWEPIILARKPTVGTVAANVQRHGTGALNVDACRIEGGERDLRGEASDRPTDSASGYDLGSRYAIGSTDLGRWPANVLLDEEAAEMLDEQTGELQAGASPPTKGLGSARVFGEANRAGVQKDRVQMDAGGASRFYYVAKPSREERDFGCKRNTHPTVKPVKLLRWLVKLVTPTDGVVLDPFMGSGTTGMACRYEHRRFIGIEREADYIAIAERRIAAVAPLFGEATA